MSVGRMERSDLGCMLFPPCVAALTTHKTQARRKLLTGGFLKQRRGLFLFPETPHGNITEIEGVPPGVQHLRIESERALARNCRRRRNERRQPVVYQRTFVVVHASQQMPQGEGIARASVRKNGVQSSFAIGSG